MSAAFFVFCEGETEAEYVRHLRSKYRIPVEVCVAKSNISRENMERFKRDKQ